MKILVTGADGLLGSNLVRVLLKRGHQIRALIQKGRRPFTLEGLDMELAEGDILDKESLLNSADGIEAIYHLAAHTSVWPSRQSIVRRVNIEGTQNVLELAKTIEVKRMVYVGTANTFSFGTKEAPGRENTPYLGANYGLDYMDSKYHAHQKVMEAVKAGLPVVIVNPTFMFGSYDSTPSSGAIVLALSKEKVPGYPPGGRNFICVKDAAIGMANALEAGRIGESYIIGNKNLTYKEAFSLIAKTLNVKTPRIPLARPVVLLYGMMGSAYNWLTGKQSSVSYEMAKISCDSHFYSSKKAVEELSLPQSPIEEGVLECYNWMKSNGIE